MVHAGARTRRPLTAVEFRPPRALGVIVGGGFAAWGFVAAVLAFSVAVGADPEFKTFLAWVFGGVCVVLGLLFAQWAYSLLTLSYVVDRETLTIRWGFRRLVVPIASIQRMVPGRTMDAAHVRGLNWWGCHIGSSEVKRIGFTLFYSTHSTPDELLYVVTTAEAYALTVLDQAAFAEEIQARAALSPVEEHVHRAEAVGVAALPFWRDQPALLTLAVSALMFAVMGSYVYANYSGLPNVVELSFPELGGVVRVGDRDELLRIAYLGAGLLAANTVAGFLVHTRERAAGLWIFAGTGLLQAVLLGASIIAFSRA